MADWFRYTAETRVPCTRPEVESNDTVASPTDLGGCASAAPQRPSHPRELTATASGVPPRAEPGQRLTRSECNLRSLRVASSDLASEQVCEYDQPVEWSQPGLTPSQDPWSQPPSAGMHRSKAAPVEVFTVGHSNNPAAKFTDLLHQHEIEVLVDVRSYPDAAYLPHFARLPLTQLVRTMGIRYLFLGEDLGGRPDGDDYYDQDGRVLYGRWARSISFQRGLSRLLAGCAQYRVAIMCSEEDPTSCHRRLLIGRALSREGPTLLRHIRADGHLDVEEGRTLRVLGGPQLGLFGPTGDEAWRSTRSVSRRSRPARSLGH